MDATSSTPGVSATCSSFAATECRARRFGRYRSRAEAEGGRGVLRRPCSPRADFKLRPHRSYRDRSGRSRARQRRSSGGTRGTSSQTLRRLPAPEERAWRVATRCPGGAVPRPCADRSTHHARWGMTSDLRRGKVRRHPRRLAFTNDYTANVAVRGRQGRHRRVSPTLRLPDLRRLPPVRARSAL